MMRRRRALPVVLVALGTTVGLASYAFTAANTLPASNAGSGTGTISGYTITNVDYSLNGTNPDNMDQVEFDMSPANADEVAIKLNAQVYTCTNAAGHATCGTTAPQATAATPTNFAVIAAQ